MYRPMFLPNGDISSQGLVNETYERSDGEESYSGSIQQTEDDMDTEYLNTRQGYLQEEETSDQSKKNWDVFEVSVQKRKQSLSIRFWNRVHVCVRVALCIFLSLLVVATSSLSRLLFLLTAYNINATNTGNTTQLTREVKINVSWLWSMIIIVAAPYAFTIIRNFFRVIFKKPRPLQIIPFTVVLLMETGHSVGLCLFVFLVAPSFNPLLVLMLCQGIGITPSFIKLWWRRNADNGVENTHEKFAKPIWRILFLISFLIQGAFVAVATWKLYPDTAHPNTIRILLPISLFLISVRWWDNFVQRIKTKHWSKNKQSEDSGHSRSGIFAKPDSLTNLLKQIDKNRVRIDLYVSLWKIILTLVIPAVVLGVGGSGCQETITFKSKIARQCGIIHGYRNVTLISTESNGCGDYLPSLVAVISVLSSGIGYKMAKSACKIRSQVWCFSIPLVLSTPLSFIIVFISFSQPVSVSDYLGCQLSWFHLPEQQDIFHIMGSYKDDYYFPIVIAGFLSMLLLCAHIWVPDAGRVAATDKLFNRPLYCGVFFDASLMMNRRSDDSINIRQDDRKQKIQEELSSNTEQEYQRNPQIPMVYVCVTMWHENEVEMSQLLKSIFKMDLDQTTRAHVQEVRGTPDKDFYQMEAHIMFDNAFGDPKEDEDPYLINKWVTKFISTINKAVSEVYISVDRLADPVKYITPYGGQLIWTLPGRNQLVVHLKHKEKIRIKKRWSQVMYMYYLLSHKMVCLEGMTKKILRKTSENTFILTLDGDVDFQPSAVHMLLDRMKKNVKVGAACGRIHPIGAGPVVWYQKFEYAMSHWLQKAAEHVIGCVLCSPGCFSMFRASALMDDNVLRKYTEKSQEPKQFIQYDQGEDRWLCTLLIQQGHRIEYCAAADAMTYAPEGFKEFFNQRRRWTPSTLANILDVLQSARRIRHNNSDISLLYIVYQGFLFISSVLTPGTIFLLIFSAINTAYPELPLYGAMLMNLIPVVVFVILLFTAKPNIQLAYAGVLSILYSLVMMVVLVGVFKQIVESSFCSMSAGFFLFVVGIFVLSALLHPQEFFNVVHGFIYFLAIPCMSLLLIFYAFGNLNVVSWGTRETNTVTVSDIENPATKRHKRSALHDMLSKMKGSDDSDSDYVFSFGNLFRCVCCPRPVLRDHTSKIELLLEKMEDVEYAFRHQNDEEEHSDFGEALKEAAEPFSQVSMLQTGDGIRYNPLFKGKQQGILRENDKDDIPRWTRDENLGDGDTDFVGRNEFEFWDELIKKHLKPIHLSEKEKTEMAEGLTRLRNTVCTFFFISNCLFVTLMFILESVSEYTPSLVFHLPCDTGDGGATREPVAIAFTLIFGVLLFIQFLCMLMHRFSTLLAIASITKFHFKSETTQEREREKFLQMIEDLYNKDRIPYDDDDRRSVKSGGSYSALSGSPGNTVKRQHTTHLMNRFLRDASQIKHKKPLYLDAIFTDNLRKVCDNMETFEKLGEEETSKAEAKRLFPGMSSQSLFVIAQMAKDKEKKNRLHEIAKKRWQSAVQRIQPNRKGFVDVVYKARQVEKQQSEHQTSPKVRYEDETAAASSLQLGEKETKHRISPVLKYEDDTMVTPKGSAPTSPVLSKGILNPGGNSKWKKATDKVVKQTGSRPGLKSDVSSFNRSSSTSGDPIVIIESQAAQPFPQGHADIYQRVLPRVQMKGIVTSHSTDFDSNRGYDTTARENEKTEL